MRRKKRAQEEVCIPSCDKLNPIESKRNNIGSDDGDHDKFGNFHTSPQPFEIFQRRRNEDEGCDKLLKDEWHTRIWVVKRTSNILVSTNADVKNVHGAKKLEPGTRVR